jgi:hypothetical protein
MSLSLNIVEVIEAHWRYHVDVFNNIGVPSYLIINMRFPSNVTFLWNDRIAILQQHLYIHSPIRLHGVAFN